MFVDIFIMYFDLKTYIKTIFNAFYGPLVILFGFYA